LLNQGINKELVLVITRFFKKIGLVIGLFIDNRTFFKLFIKVAEKVVAFIVVLVEL
jgi:hypothetical protein